MSEQSNVIITCAITGAIHTPTMSPHLPITPAQIAEQAIGAAQAGAAIVHLHARDPEDGRPTQNPAIFRQFLPVIRDASDVVINVTTGGGHGMTVEQRLEAALDLKPEMCSLNMGSFNIGTFQLLPRYETWKHDWEPEQLEMSREFIFKNTFGDIEFILEKIGRGCGTRFEYECYDVGHLYNLAHFLDRGLVRPPLFVQTIFGLLGGIGTDAENLLHMKRIADKLFGRDYLWSILAAGRHEFRLCTMGAAMGGNVRVGLEDNLYLGKGVLAESNAVLVTRMREILDRLSIPIATPAEARQRLGLKGMSEVGF